MDVDDIILEYFEENDWEMSLDTIEKCATQIKGEFQDEDEAVDYIHGYIKSMFND